MKLKARETPLSCQFQKKEKKKKKALFQEGKGTRCPKKFPERLVQQVLCCYSLSVTNTGIKGKKKVPLLALMTKK